MGRRTLVAAVAMATFLTACSTSDPGESNGKVDTQGVTDDSIKVGGLIVKTSSFGTSFASTELGFKARIDRANEEGGVHGRKIEFVGAEDDGGDPSKDIAAVRKLVQQEEVFAVAPVNTFSFAGAKFLQQNNIPYFGWGYSAPEWCGPDVAFSFNGCTGSAEPGTQSAGFFEALIAGTGPADGRSLALIGHDDPNTKAINAIGADAAEELGFKVVDVQNDVPQTSVPTDWSPYVNKLLKSDGGGAPNVIFSTMGTPFNAGLFAALKSAGFNGDLMDGISYNDSTLKNPEVRAAFEGAYVTATIEPPIADTEAASVMRDDLAKATGDSDFEWSQDMGVGYAIADVFLSVLEKAGKDLTTEGFLEAASDITVESPYGGTISFPAGHTEPNGCASLVQVKDEEWTLASPLVCKTFSYSG